MTTISFLPSPEQHDIFAFDFSSNLLISAVAGSGKTTTLIHLLSHLPSDPSALLSPAILFLAFNKTIADTLRSRVPDSVSCSTFHSLGLRALKSILDPSLTKRSGFVDARKTAKILFSLTDKSNPDFKSILRAVSLLKSRWPTPDGLSASTFLRDADIDLVDFTASVSLALRVLERSNRDTTSIDFDDMLLMPLIHNASFDQQDYVLVDEAQDLNDIQLEILSRLGKPSTRYVFVGDPNQAIYAFRGANADSLDRIATRFATTSLPLSVSRRCPALVVKEAQKYCK